MNRVVKRTWLMVLFILVLVGGVAFFGYEYATQASSWIGSPGSSYIHNSAIGYGTVVDRSGDILLDIGATKTYSADPMTRQATMHWLGDRQGNIASHIIGHYAGDMSGYDVIFGDAVICGFKDDYVPLYRHEVEAVCEMLKIC